MSEVLELFNTRFSYAGQIPLTYPGLNPVALGRMNSGSGAGRYADGVNTSREWVYRSNGTPINWTRARARMGNVFQLNGVNPESERGRLQLDYFSGLWPSGGRLLIGGWFWQKFAMAFNPLMDTRATDPFVYLSTSGATGQPRAQVYSASGSLLLDQYESGLPWAFEYEEPYYLGMFVDLDEGTSRLFSVQDSTGQTWIGPVRTFGGTPNLSCTANLDMFSLRHANYWEAVEMAETTVAHPSSGFDLNTFVEDMGHSVWANSQDRRIDQDLIFSVSETGVTASSSGTFYTGAERLSWGQRPTYSTLGSGASSTFQISHDDGDTWADAPYSSRPEEADNVLVRFNVTMNSGATFQGIELTIPDAPDIEVTPATPDHDPETNTVTVAAQEGVVWSPDGPGQYSIPETGTLVIEASPASGYTFPSGATTRWEYEYTWPDPPTLGPISDVELVQGGDLYTAQLDYDVPLPPYRWDVSGSTTLATVTMDDGILSVSSGFETGTSTYVIRLTDDRNRSVEREFNVTVVPRPWSPGPPPRYPHAPIVLWDEESPQEVLIDPISAVVIEELNGEQAFELSVPSKHPHRHLLQTENVVEAAGERYHIRRITSERRSGVPTLNLYCEARFYDLRVAGGVDPQEWNQTLPGPVIETALRGTGWTVDVVQVGTRRTYAIEERTNPLALLRLVQENHGGDLIFDNVNRRVSLVVQSGRDQGVGFFYASNLNSAKRVEDTSSMVTRIYARNEDGRTIASVNNGVPYLEDFTHSSEVRETTYNFKAGTSPYTMLEMTRAVLGNRSKPDISYECSVSDLSAETDDDLDRFEVGDRVTVSDPEVGIEAESQRIVGMEYNLLEPWNSGITLSARLRETGTSDGTEDSLGTGSTVDTFDLVPFNLLLNARFDNGLAHWANSGVTVVETDRGTGDYAVRFAGSGNRWIEQTVQPDNRRAYAFSMEVNSRGGPEAWVPDVVVQAEITYEDGTSEIVELDVGGDTDYAGDDPEGL